MIQDTRYKIPNKKTKGFTLIEGLVLLFIFSLITVTFYNVMSVGSRFILTSKNRLGAIALANEKMEIIRNLSYDNVGIVGGVVSGNIPQDEDATENGKNYHVKTLVQYEDDPFDGTLGGTPNDAAFKDYKIAKIIVSWNNGGTDQGDVSIVSQFVPPGMEVTSTGDGILSINILSSQAGGSAVPQASVHIVNTDVGINETTLTDNTGNVMLVGAPESIQRYQITVSKSGYETVTTLPAYPDTAYNPIDTHASVTEGLLNTANIDLNMLSNLSITTEDPLGNEITDIDFDLIGGRLIGHEVVSPFNNIYNLNESDDTGDDGKIEYEDISPGEYTLTINLGGTNYALISPSFTVDALDSSKFNSTIHLSSDNTEDIIAKLADTTVTGLVMNIVKSEDNSPIEGAEVKLSNTALSFNESVITGSDGIAYFPQTGALQAGTYDFEIKASGFDDITDQVEITDGTLLINTVPME